MMSLTALSTDAMLPALPQIGSELGVQNANDRQLVVSVLFLGLAFGVVGSLSRLISMPLGTVIGQRYNGTVLPLVAGMALLYGLCIFAVRWAESD